MFEFNQSNDSFRLCSGSVVIEKDQRTKPAEGKGRRSSTEKERGGSPS